MTLRIFILLFLIFLLAPSLVFPQNNFTPKIEFIENYNLNDSSNYNKFYNIDTSTIFKIIRSSTKEFKIAFSFAYFCKPCLESFPFIKQLIDEKQVEVILITDIKRTDKAKLMHTYNFVRNKNAVNLPVFFIGKNCIDSTNKKKDVYFHFFDLLQPKNDAYGYSLFLVFDKNNKLLYASNYHEKSINKIVNVKKIIGTN
jgi:thiol-disulfide isomerase/thioredoxin